MKMGPTLLLIYVMLTSLVSARLGESPQQLQARFGTPSGNQSPFLIISQGHTYPVGQILIFTSGDWSINCTMINGSCEQITYSKTGDFSEEQLTTVLNNESQGSKWSETHTWKTFIDGIFMPQYHVREWKRDDGAYASRTGTMVTLTTATYDRAVTATKDQGTAAAQKTPANL